MHIEDGPTGLVIGIPVDALDDSPMIRADNRTIRDSHNPIIAVAASKILVSWGEIQRCPG
jgi:hypothetical protein